MRIPSILKNKFLLAGLAFLIWVLFFDERDLFTTLHQYRELKALEESRDHYRKEIDQTKLSLDQLKNNPDTLEKFARERYRFKKENEDLFIVNEWFMNNYAKFLVGIQ